MKQKDEAAIVEDIIQFLVKFFNLVLTKFLIFNGLELNPVIIVKSNSIESILFKLIILQRKILIVTKLYIPV